LKSTLLCFCILFLIMVTAIAGCSTSTGTTGNAQPLPSPPPAESMTVPTVTGNHTADINPCPVPPLMIDTRQQMTKIPNGFNFDNDNQSYPLPAGSIIFHGTDGVTRVFDQNGTQLLAANDSESMMPTPGAGLMASTKVLQVPSGALVQADGNMTHIILNGTCIGTTVSSDTSPAPSDRVCHCPMMPVQSVTTIPTATPDDGLCHCS
jgi:hypothetical protein